MSKVYIVRLAEIVEAELIKERLQSFLVKNKRGFQFIAYKFKTYHNREGCNYFNVEKSFLSKGAALLFAKEQAQAHIFYHQEKISEVVDKVFYVFNKYKTKCPWPDYAGNELFDGDIIKHPDGESGIIEFRPGEETIHRQWGVNYGDNSIALLSLQLGDKGQAVKVVQNNNETIKQIQQLDT